MLGSEREVIAPATPKAGIRAEERHHPGDGIFRGMTPVFDGRGWAW
jgi:hypothetical protein